MIPNFKILDITCLFKDCSNHVLLVYNDKLKIIYKKRVDIEETLDFIRFFNRIEETIKIKSSLCSYSILEVYVVNYDFHFWSKVNKNNFLYFNDWFTIGYNYFLSEQAEIRGLKNYLIRDIVFETFENVFASFNSSEPIIHKYSNGIEITHNETIKMEFDKTNLLFIFMLLEEKVSGMMWYHEIDSSNLLYKIEIDSVNSFSWFKITPYDIELYNILCNINCSKIKIELKHKNNLNLWKTGYLITHYQTNDTYNNTELNYIIKNF